MTDERFPRIDFMKVETQHVRGLDAYDLWVIGYITDECRSFILRAGGAWEEFGESEPITTQTLRLWGRAGALVVKALQQGPKETQFSVEWDSDPKPAE